MHSFSVLLTLNPLPFTVAQSSVTISNQIELKRRTQVGGSAVMGGSRRRRTTPREEASKMHCPELLI
uniref:Secreted protein n=1 Tax=Rhizophora mucronata TaxID=61149 RepID=A0A2P2Q7Q5_RHIMU